MADSREPSASEEWASPRYGAWVVLVLTLAYTCSFIDRQILTLLIEPIRRDLHVTDTQVSLLGGLAFSIFYTTLGVPLARLADRVSRRNLMAVGLACWTTMTAASGLARGFWSLFAARVGVGVGEAALSPAAFSLLADTFPAKRLGRAISIYSTGVYFGAGLALLIGGRVIQAVSQAQSHVLPLVGEVYPWQMTFFIVGGLGLPLIALMMTIREPRRRGLGGASKPTSEASSWSALRAFMRENARAITAHIASFTLFGIAIGSYLFWSPSLMIRTHGWTAPQAGFTVGLLMFTFGTGGVYFGGYVADRLAAAGRPDAFLYAARLGMIASLPFAIATPLIESPSLATASLAAAIFFLAYPQGLPSAALQVITPNPLRAQLTSIYFFIGNLIANGIGPTIPALLTDYVFKDPLSLRYAITLVAGISAPLSIAVLSWGLSSYGAAVQRAEERVG